MGKWITPKVVIEKFAPNQYVAVCSVEVPSNLLYVDIAKGRGGNIQIDGWGNPDLYHQWSEAIESRNGNTIQFDMSLSVLDWDNPSPGWYRSISFYSNYRSALYVTRWLEYYGSTEQYDIEVYQRGNNWYADVYITGTADAAASGKSPSNHS